MALLLNGSSANIGGLHPSRKLKGYAEDGTTLIREYLEGQDLEFLDVDWTAGGDNKSIRTGRTNVYKVVRAAVDITNPAAKPVTFKIDHDTGFEYRAGTWISGLAANSAVPALIADEWLTEDLKKGDLFLVIVKGITMANIGNALNQGQACGVVGSGTIGKLDLTVNSGIASLAAHQIGYAMMKSGTATGKALIEVGRQVGL